MRIINAENLILGRMAAFVAKKAILGETIEIINCEKAVMTGNKKEIFARYKTKREMGQVYHGPYIMRNPDRFTKRAIRGMLPYKQPKGKAAFERITCHKGVPEELKDKESQTIERADIAKTSSLKYVTIADICKSMGAKR